MIIDLLALVAGLVILVVAADHFVIGAARVAGAIRMPPVVIGAVVIGFGTSLPEMVVSIIAAGGGDRDLGVGNIVGSNVANLGLVLGVASFVATMTISSTTLRREIPLSIGAAALFAAFAVDGRIERWEGVVLAIALVGSIVFLVRSGMADELDDDLHEVSSVPLESLRTLAGLVGTVVGAQLVVVGATDIADRFGVTGGFVGFSLVALGTSLPELVTTIACARRGETELILGNLFGSNLFNSLAVGGGIGLVGPGLVGDDRLTTWGLAAMMVVAIVTLLLGIKGRCITRRNGVVLVGLYLAAMAILGIGATDESENVSARTVSSASRQDDRTGGGGLASGPERAGCSMESELIVVDRDAQEGLSEFAPEIVVLVTDGAVSAGVDPIEAATQAAERRVSWRCAGTERGDGLSGAHDPQAPVTVRRP